MDQRIIRRILAHCDLKTIFVCGCISWAWRRAAQEIPFILPGWRISDINRILRDILLCDKVSTNVYNFSGTPVFKKSGDFTFHGKPDFKKLIEPDVSDDPDECADYTNSKIKVRSGKLYICPQNGIDPVRVVYPDLRKVDILPEHMLVCMRMVMANGYIYDLEKSHGKMSDEFREREPAPKLKMLFADDDTIIFSDENSTIVYDRSGETFRYTPTINKEDKDFRFLGDLNKADKIFVFARRAYFQFYGFNITVEVNPELKCVRLIKHLHRNVRIFGGPGEETLIIGDTLFTADGRNYASPVLSKIMFATRDSMFIMYREKLHSIKRGFRL